MQTPASSTLNEIDQELIAVGASLASGCLPCLTFHFRAARAAGASADDIRQAVLDALEVRQEASTVMARKAWKLLGDLTEGNLPATDGLDKPLLRELVCVSAAYALNCTTSLAVHFAAARRQGADDGQLFTAIKIACAVKSMAGRKAEAAAAEAFGVTKADMDECECRDDSEKVRAASPSTVSAEARDGRGGCSCGEGECQSSSR